MIIGIYSYSGDNYTATGDDVAQIIKEIANEMGETEQNIFESTTFYRGLPIKVEQDIVYRVVS